MEREIILLAVIVLVAYGIQALSGFGSTILAVTLGSHLYPLAELLPVLVLLDIVITGYIAVRHRQHIDREILLRRILPLMLVGVAVGLGLFYVVSGSLLKKVLGGFVVIISVYELYVIARKLEARAALPAIQSGAFMLAAGLVQGLYASGGPLLVYVTGRLGLSKAVFRSTLSALWLLLALVMISTYAFGGRVTTATWKLTGLMLPATVLGLAAGEFLHRYTRESTFRIIVFVLLLFAGASILLN